MSHTKEPWDTDGFSSVGATGSDQFNGGFFTANCEGPDKIDNARRIVACVNACAGIGTEYLERFGGTSFNDFKRVKYQRDELLAALEDACVCIGFDGLGHGALIQLAEGGHKTVQSLLRFRRMIASMKGGAA